MCFLRLYGIVRIETCVCVCVCTCVHVCPFERIWNYLLSELCYQPISLTYNKPCRILLLVRPISNITYKVQHNWATVELIDKTILSLAVGLFWELTFTFGRIHQLFAWRADARIYSSYHGTLVDAPQGFTAWRLDWQQNTLNKYI